jgi:hypothetical protein
MMPNSDPSEEIPTTPSEPIQRTKVPASSTEGAEPNAKRDLATSYEAPANCEPEAQVSGTEPATGGGQGAVVRRTGAEAGDEHRSKVRKTHA